MSNQLLTISMITDTALPVLGNTCVVTDKFNRQYSDEFARKDAKIGATVSVRRPPRYLGTFGPALNVEPSYESYIPVSLNYQFHVDIQFNTVNMLLDISNFRERFIKPACAAVGNRIDSDGSYFAYQNTAIQGGTFGTSPTAYKTFSDLRAILAFEGAPKEQTPCVILDPLSMSSMSDALKGLYNPQVKISQNYEKGLMYGKTAGFDWFEDQNIASFTTGAYSGSNTVVLAGGTSVAGGTALLTTGWAQNGTFETSGWSASSNAVVVGDIIQIQGVYPVNPQNRGQYGKALKQFVVIAPGGYAPVYGTATPGGPAFAAATLANGTFTASSGQYVATAGGLLTIYVSECLISGGQFQNVTAAPVSTYKVYVNGSANNTTSGAVSTVSPQGLAFYRDAFALAFADLPLPRTAVEASRASDPELGMSIRIATQYTINNDAEPTRMDVLYGFSSLYRQLGARVAG